MKANKRSIIIIAAAILLIGLGVAIGFVFHSSSKNISVGFYRISGQHEETIKKLLEESVKDDPKTEFRFLALKDEMEIVPQAKKVDVLFTPMGLAADKAVASIPQKKIKDVFFDSDIIAGASISAANFAMKTFGSKDGKISQVPLFFDGYEMLISIYALSGTKTETVSSWADVEALAAKTKSALSGIGFAGGDPDSLLAVISAVTEAFDGKEKYDSLIEKIKTYDGPMSNLFERIYQEDDAFHGAMDRIASWKKKNLFNIELLDKTNEDLINLIEEYRFAIIIMPLSEHRKISSETARYLTSLPVHSNETNFYFPSMRPLNTRSTLTPCVAMISMSDSQKAKDAVKVLTYPDAQEKLAFGTGLSPLLANCKIPDLQSDDLRFWIAATSEPSVPMGDAAFDDKNKKEEFAQSIRNWIRNQ